MPLISTDMAKRIRAAGKGISGWRLPKNGQKDILFFSLPGDSGFLVTPLEYSMSPGEISHILLVVVCRGHI